LKIASSAFWQLNTSIYTYTGVHLVIARQRTQMDALAKAEGDYWLNRERYMSEKTAQDKTFNDKLPATEPPPLVKRIRFPKQTSTCELQIYLTHQWVWKLVDAVASYTLNIEPLKVQCLGNYLAPFWGSIWNLVAQSIMEPFQEPCIIVAGTLNGNLFLEMWWDWTLAFHMEALGSIWNSVRTVCRESVANSFFRWGLSVVGMETRRCSVKHCLQADTEGLGQTDRQTDRQRGYKRHATVTLVYIQGGPKYWHHFCTP